MKRKCKILGSSIVSILLISALVGCTNPGSNPVSSASTSSSSESTENSTDPLTMIPQVADSDAITGNIDSKVRPGGSSGSFKQEMAINSSGLDWWKSSYSKFNGWITRGFTFTNDNEGKCIIQIDVTTKAGELDITVMDAEGTKLNTYKNIATSTFDINLGNGGNYQIRVDAQNHDGGFSIKQKTSDA